MQEKNGSPCLHFLSLSMPNDSKNSAADIVAGSFLTTFFSDFCIFLNAFKKHFSKSIFVFTLKN